MQSQDCALHYSTSRSKIETKYLCGRYYRYCRYYWLTQHLTATPTRTVTRAARGTTTLQIFSKTNIVCYANANTKYGALFILIRVLNNSRNTSVFHFGRAVCSCCQTGDCWTSCFLCCWRACLERSSCRRHFSTFSVHFPKTFKTASLFTFVSWPSLLI